MKKRIYSLFILIATVALLFIPMFAISASAAETTASIKIKDYASSKGWSNSTKYTSVSVDANITATVSGGTNTGKYYTSGYDWRLYQTENARLTIKASEAYNIVSVTITYTVSNGGTLKSNSGTNVSSASKVTVNANSVTFSVGNTGTATNGQVRITNISVTYTQAECTHTKTSTETVDATCTATGSITVTCDDCGKVISEEVIPTTAHSYTDGICSGCGASDPENAPEGATKTTVKVNISEYAAANNWTNDKKYPEISMDSNISVSTTGGSYTGKYFTSGTNWRIYQTDSGTFTISAAGNCTVISVKITYSTSNNGVLMHGSTKVESDALVNVNASSITFVAGNTGSATNGQVRITAIEVVYFSATCEHESTTTATVNATCTLPGSTTVTCNDCGETVSTVDIPATGHLKTTTTTNAATCTENGSTTVTCNDCDETLSSTVIPASGHSYVDGTCTTCGNEKLTDALGLDGKKFYIATVRTSGNYFFMSNDLGTASTVRYTAVDSSYAKLPPFIANDRIDNKYVFVFEFNEDGTYCIYAYGISSDEKYLGHESGNSGILVTKTNALKLTVRENDGNYEIFYTLGDVERYLALNSNSGNDYFAFYTGEEQRRNLALIPLGECAHESLTTVTVKAATCTEKGESLTSCIACQNLISSNVIDALGHTLVDSICAKCGHIESGDEPGNTPTEPEWTLVTNVEDLKAGDQIIIVAQGYNYALSTSQGNNNRGQMAVTKGNNTVTFGDGVQIITLANGKISGTFALYTGSGYLYAASSSANYLRTETTLSNNSSWKITIASNGTATIVAQGSNSRNTMQYNQSNSLFACYSSASQKPIVIYKLSGNDSGSESPATEIIGASMSVGSTLAMNYYIAGCTENDYMIFTMNGKMSDPVYGVQEGNYFKFSFTNIPPQFMGDIINATLYSEDGEIIAEATPFSVKEYAIKVLDLYSSNGKLSNLVADMLKYGAAAQEYRNYKTDSLVTDGIDLNGKGNAIAPTNAAINVKKLTTAIESSEYFFTQAGVRFDFDNKLYVKFTAKGEGTVTLRCNGKYATIEEIEDGVFVAYSSGISATEFDKEYKFELYVDGNLHQTVTYSVNSYIYTKYNDGKTTDVDALVIALYSYGLSAKEYKNA